MGHPAHPECIRRLADLGEKYLQPNLAICIIEQPAGRPNAKWYFWYSTKPEMIEYVRFYLLRSYRVFHKKIVIFLSEKRFVGTTYFTRKFCFFFTIFCLQNSKILRKKESFDVKCDIKITKILKNRIGVQISHVLDICQSPGIRIILLGNAP